MPSTRLKTQKLVIIITSCEIKHSSRRGRHCILSETLFLVFREALLCFSAGLKHFSFSTFRSCGGPGTIIPILQIRIKVLKYLSKVPRLLQPLFEA